MSYEEETTYRWAVVCPGYYVRLDSPDGAADIGGRFFTMASQSHGDKAGALTEAAYLAWQRREARKLGLDADAV